MQLKLFGIGLYLLYALSGYSQINYINKMVFDSSVSPADNFFKYVNGVWLKNPDFPRDDWKGDWGAHITADFYTQKKLTLLLQKLLQNKNAVGSLEKKVSDFYYSFFDSVSVNELSYTPLQPLLNEIDAVQIHKDLYKVIAELLKENGEKVTGYGVWPDDKNIKINILKFSQAGNTFSNYENYFKVDSSSAMNRKALVDLATSYFKILGEDERTAKTNAALILELEKKLVGSWVIGTALRDPNLNYNKVSVTEANKLTPDFMWDNLLKAMDISTDSINIAQPKYFQTLGKLLSSEPLAVWKAKLKFDFIYKNAFLLSTDISNHKVNFLRITQGNFPIATRSEAAAYWTREYLKDAVSQLYIKEYFNPHAKTKVQHIAENIRRVFINRIKKLPWMTEEAKVVAITKLKKMIINVAYPDEWVTYDSIRINRKGFYDNLRNVLKHNYEITRHSINKPVNRKIWIYTPIHTSAVYSWLHNSITLPAGTLQLPYFDIKADDAINYGGIGTVIAHEMTHGFDNIGRRYDDVGNLENWWKPEDENNFQDRANKMIEQYSKLIVYDSLKINSPLTFNENLADLGGVTLAYEAFQKTKQVQSNKTKEGFTPDQRFFISYALKHKVFNTITKNIQSNLNTSIHAPSEVRVNAPLKNFTPFYKAFNVSEKNKMFLQKKERVIVW